MTSRSRAAQFARELDIGGPVEHGAAVGALRDLGADLEPATAARPEFRAALRTRLLAVAAVAPAPARERRRPALRSRRMGIVLAALATVLVVLGAGLSASRSLPGDTLYGAKRATERLQLRTADGPLEEGMRHLQFAETRLREVRALAAQSGPAALGPGPVLAGGGDSRLIDDTLTDMDAETVSGSGLVVRASRQAADPAPLAVLQAWSGQQADRVRAVGDTLPSAARQRADTSLSVLAQVAADATAGLVGAPR